MQTKLDSFFKKGPPKKLNSNKYFVYDWIKQNAYFTTKIEKTDKFVCHRSGLDLYLRCGDVESPKFNKLYNGKITSAPLLKSNLQKAIRRGNILVSAETAMALIAFDKAAFFRRLPIIVVEDVALCESFPMLIWFMIADNDYILKDYDVHLVIQTIIQLCKTKQYFYCPENHPEFEGEITHEMIESWKSPIQTHLLSLYYRFKYGGMKGDLKMLRYAIEFYKENDKKIVPIAKRDEIKFDNEPEILPEAIDFHPYPRMIQDINEILPEFESYQIKELIWKVDSCINFRKKYLLNRAREFSESEEWKQIKPILDKIREKIIHAF